MVTVGPKQPSLPVDEYGQRRPGGSELDDIEIRSMNPGDADGVCEVIGLEFAGNPSTLANVRGDRAKAPPVVRALCESPSSAAPGATLAERNVADVGVTSADQRCRHRGFTHPLLKHLILIPATASCGVHGNVSIDQELLSGHARFLERDTYARSDRLVLDKKNFRPTNCLQYLLGQFDSASNVSDPLCQYQELVTRYARSDVGVMQATDQTPGCDHSHFFTHVPCVRRVGNDERVQCHR